MAFQKNYDAAEPVTAPACVHLRSKAMYVAGDLRNYEHPDEAGGADACWCNLTQHIMGPDDKDVNRRECIAKRTCFVEIQ